MTEQAKELRDQIAHHETMAAHHTHLATSLRIQYETLCGGTNVDWGNGLLKKRPTKSRSRWISYLKQHGPATRQTIADVEGLLTGDVPPYADSLGLSMAELVEASYPEDFLLRLSAENPHGKGRPVDVYFLWSQRFDVKPIYGVGPVRPDPKAMLGVVQPEPPVAEASWAKQAWDYMQDESPEPTEEDPPIQTVDTWREQHAVVLSLVGQGIKPNPEQFALLRSTHPDGADGANIAVALAAKGIKPEQG